MLSINLLIHCWWEIFWQFQVPGTSARGILTSESSVPDSLNAWREFSSSSKQALQVGFYWPVNRSTTHVRIYFLPADLSNFLRFESWWPPMNLQKCFISWGSLYQPYSLLNILHSCTLAVQRCVLPVCQSLYRFLSVDISSVPWLEQM